MRATIKVSNTGDRAGTETVQVYARKEHASRVRPRRELAGFERVTLDGGESADVTVEIPDADLGFYKSDAGHVVESGSYHLHVGDLATSVAIGSTE